MTSGDDIKSHSPDSDANVPTNPLSRPRSRDESRRGSRRVISPVGARSEMI